jgi:hypothetical protein
MTRSGPSAPAPSRTKAAADPDVGDAPLPEPRRGLKPRKKLFAALLVLLALWVGLLVVMYVTTVYPIRHGEKGALSPAAPESPEE